MISIIAAIGKNNELGKGNELLWKLPADMKHFKETTTGHTVVMGRKTFQSIGRALPNRRNIVVTRDETFAIEGVEVAHSLGEAIEKVAGEEEAFIIGGGELYKQALPFTDKLYITHVDSEFDADTFFPHISEEWKKVSEEEHLADETNPFAYTFAVYEK